MRYQLEVTTALTNLLGNSSEFGAAVSSRAAENGFSASIAAFLERTSRKRCEVDHKCSMNASICPVYTTKSELLTNIALCKFILNLSFTNSSMLEKTVLISTLENLTHLAAQLPLLACHLQKTTSSFPALLEELATPSVVHPSRQWQESIANDLIRDAHTKYNSIILTVGTVCRDLEHRCATVEQPLRKAEEVIEDLKERLGKSDKEKNAIEEKCAGLVKEIEDIRNQKEELAYELRCARSEMEGCRLALEEQREQSRAAVEREREIGKEREEELIRTNAILDDELKEAQMAMKQLNEQVGIYVPET